MYFISCILVIFGAFFVISSYGKSFWSFVYVGIYCVSAGITNLMFFSDGVDPFIFLSKDGENAVYEKKRTEMFLFPAKVGVFCL